MEISVLSYNIHKGFRVGNTKYVLGEIRELLRSLQCDIVCLQEVVGEKRRRSDGEGSYQAQYEYLADSVWNDFSYGKNAVYTDGHHGNAILSRFPIAQWSNFDLSTNKLERRGLLFSKIKVPGSKVEINAFCTHLNLAKGSQAVQLERIIEQVKENSAEKTPLIIAGDFNDWSGSSLETLFQRVQLKEVIKEFAGRPLHTFPSYYPVLSLDRIFVKNVRIIEAQVFREMVWRKLSDHLPVYARLEI